LLLSRRQENRIERKDGPSLDRDEHSRSSKASFVTNPTTTEGRQNRAVKLRKRRTSRDVNLLDQTTKRPTAKTVSDPKYPRNPRVVPARVGRTNLEKRSGARFSKNRNTFERERSRSTNATTATDIAVTNAEMAMNLRAEKGVEIQRGKSQRMKKM